MITTIIKITNSAVIVVIMTSIIRCSSQQENVIVIVRITVFVLFFILFNELTIITHVSIQPQTSFLQKTCYAWLRGLTAIEDLVGFSEYWETQ